MLIKILKAGILSGIIAGLITAVFQLVIFVPIISTSELFESGAVDYFDGDVPLVQLSSLIFEPRDMRQNLYTVLATVLSAVGFSLFCICAMLIRGGDINIRQGSVWGIMGFTSVVLFPALGLAPELPGSGSAELELRQVWWVGAVISTAIGIWLVAFKDKLMYIALGVFILAFPHIIGAPLPVEYIGSAPPELSAKYTSTLIVISFIMWVIIGSACGHFYNKDLRHLQLPAMFKLASEKKQKT